MIPAGFTLEYLSVSGPNKPDARISFSKGVNFITGESNSGKTYIFQCLDFMLGASTPPKEIAEQLGYELITLELIDKKGTRIKLERSLRGGEYRKIIGEKSEILLVKHVDGRSDTISALFLELSGYKNAKLRKNVNNATNSLTWRTISSLFIVSELKIIDEKSPFSGDAFDVTTLMSAVRFIFTGNDDSALVAQKSIKLQKAEKQGEISVYENFVMQTRLKIQETKAFLDGKDLSLIEDSLQTAKQQFEATNLSIAQAQLERNQLFQEARKLNAEVLAKSEVLSRFQTLRQHYISDLDRLEFIDEGQDLFSQLHPVRCATCGQLLTEGHSHEDKFDSEAFRIGTMAESEKIQKHLIDLESTIRTIQEQRSALSSQYQFLQEVLILKDKEISEQFLPKRQFEIAELNSVIELRNRFDELPKLELQLQSYEFQIQTLKKPNAVLQEKIETGIPEIVVRKFCALLESILETWQFPNPKPITFNQKTMDIVVDGKTRVSNGKGFRAILNTAMYIALLRFCENNDLPHPGFFIVDSPLVNLRLDRDTNLSEEIIQNLETCFLSDLIQQDSEHQIILFDNKEASEDLRNSVNYIEFSRTKEGVKKGFFDT